MGAAGIVRGQDALTMVAEVSDRDGSGRSARQNGPPAPRGADSAQLPRLIGHAQPGSRSRAGSDAASTGAPAGQTAAGKERRSRQAGLAPTCTRAPAGPSRGKDERPSGSGGDGAQAQGGAAADGEDAAVQLGGRPGVVDGGDLLAVEADGALADQPPGLAPRAGEPGLGQQRDEVDLTVCADRAGGDRQLLGGTHV